MLRFESKTGYYLYPKENRQNVQQQMFLNIGTTYEVDVSSRNDIYLEKYGLIIPVAAANYDDFKIRMKSSEDELREHLTSLGNSKAFVPKGDKYTVDDLLIVKTGEYVKFGSYPQNNGRARKPIEWLVLEVNDKEAFLVSRYGLDSQPYNREYADITWENCDLRKWLNNDFLMSAFSEEEQQRIKLSEVVNDDNRQYGTWGGNNTRDRVFCLSLAEVELYFNNVSGVLCQQTGHARNQGRRVDDDNACCHWWLRSPGYNQCSASCVDADGVLSPPGFFVNGANIAVRPALRLIWSLDPSNNGNKSLSGLKSKSLSPQKSKRH